MQTFLPMSSLKASADALDKKRAFKQVVECGQIINVLEGRSTGWKNHPAVKMWAEHASGLKYYHDLLYDVCATKYGIKFVKTKKFNIAEYSLPSWFGDDKLHSSHRSNLLRKDLNYYSQFGWHEDASLPYYWPTNEHL